MTSLNFVHSFSEYMLNRCPIASPPCFNLTADLVFAEEALAFESARNEDMQVTGSRGCNGEVSCQGKRRRARQY